MKKITSLVMMLVLFCTGAFAQDPAEFKNKLIKAGTVQSELVPGTWYFLHTPRNPNQNSTAFGLPGDAVQVAGGFAQDHNGKVYVSTHSTIEALTTEDGAIGEDYLANLVRFVEATEGGYNIQFGTGNWIGDLGDSGNGTQLTTVNNNQYVAGNAGKYNFYLVPNVDGVPNAAGRFAWNKFDMQQRVDNNGTGNGIVFWGSGETAVGEEHTWATDEEIIGNKIYQIYDVVVVGEIDAYDKMWMSLVELYNDIYATDDYSFVDNLAAGVNVGESYGNYRPEDVNAFLEVWNQVVVAMEAVDMGEAEPTTYWATVEELEAFYNQLEAAFDAVEANKVPLAVTNIQPGYYTINSMLNWTESQNIYYTQEEADQLNEESGAVEGDEDFVTTETVKETITVDAPVKSLFGNTYQGNEWLAWANQKPQAQYLWKIETVEGRPSAYRLINMYKGQTFNEIPTSANSQLKDDDTVTVAFDYIGVGEAPVIAEEVTYYGIRLTKSAVGSANYIHCGGHNGGAGVSGYTVGWTADASASNWYLTPIDEATAQEWMNSDEAKLKKMVTEGDLIVGTVPAQIEIAKDIVVTIFDNDSVATDVSQFSSPWTEASEGSIEALLDGNPNTFWHSAWSGGNAEAHVHYLQIAANEPLEGLYSVRMHHRLNGGAALANDNAKKLVVKGYDEDNAELTFEDGDSLGVLTLALGSPGELITGSNLFEGKGHTYLRFYWEESHGSNQRGYFHLGDFNVFRAESGTAHEKTQYEVRKDIIEKLQAAVDVWNAGEFAEDSIELYTDPTFQEAYKNLTEAAAAWEAVYVDPANLRAAIEAAPAKELFVVGNNPGEWASADAAPTGVVNAAQSYDESGAYTPAESEKWIKDIEDAITKAYAAANPIEENKWYRFKFSSEEAYDQFGWDKTGAQAVINGDYDVQTSAALFGKTIAAGKMAYEYVPIEGVEDTLATYITEGVENIYNGNELVFFEDDSEYEAGQDLFRFIKATDSTFIAQHKSGLFLRGGHPATLSVIPSFFKTTAVGAGASVISYYDALGEQDGYNYLHGERSTNRLVSWNAYTLGSNSALLIEEVEAVTDVPATAYEAKLWPGSTYAYTYPVDVQVVSGAQAYGAKLAVTETDTTVVLMTLTDETIKAGTPFILIADCDGDYRTYDEVYNDYKAEFAVESWGFFDKQEVDKLMEEEYAIVAMDHGMKVDTIVNEYCDLVGTMRNVDVEAGKALITKENGFAHTISATTIGAYSAYVASDFDGESADVLGSISVKIEGEITGINDVLNAVAKSGNIYTIDGKLVGKGNINAISNMPAGIYVVNGVKMIKK